jgi:phosphofructokinase-like protein
MTRKKRIAILTGGGDCPGMNAVIRTVTKKAILEHDMDVIGILDGYDGVINNCYRELSFDDVSGIITLGGTILGTSNRANPYQNATKENGKLVIEDVSRTAIDNIKKLEIECLICVGGDGTLTIASQLFHDGIPIVGIPKTIDNDLRGTDITFGFDSAVDIATGGIDRLHSTAQSHHRVMIIEVMGRNSGWIALYSGIAGGGDIILIPEIPYDINNVANAVKERTARGKRFSIIVVSEGAKVKDGEQVVKRIVEGSPDPIRLGGISFKLASEIEELTGVEARAVVLGHLQRGGTPSAFDRVLATRLGTRAMDMVSSETYGFYVGVKGSSLVEVPLEEASKGQRLVSLDDPLISAARSVGTSFGDGALGM